MLDFAEISSYLPPFTPLLRLFTGLSLGLFIASLLEALNLTRPIAKLAHPLVRYAHLSDVSAAAFALALFSPATSNAFIGEKLEEKKISNREVIILNLFNSLPSTIVHLPTVFFIAFPILGMPALIYVSLSFLAALLRTLTTVFIGRLLLPVCDVRCENHREPKTKVDNFWKLAFKTGVSRFLKRCPRLIYISIPIYIIIFYLQLFGFFEIVEKWLSTTVGFSFLNAKSLSVVMLYMAAEMQAALVAAATLYNNQSINGHEVVLALLIGNLLSTPMRGIRHQLPAYMGYYNARFAVKLIIVNQAFRMISLLIVTIIYYTVYF